MKWKKDAGVFGESFGYVSEDDVYYLQAQPILHYNKAEGYTVLEHRRDPKAHKVLETKKVGFADTKSEAWKELNRYKKEHWTV